MRKALTAILGVLVVASMSVLSVPVIAAEPDEVSGTMSQVSSETLWMKNAGPNIIMLNHNVWNVFGDLQGELVSEPRVMIFGTGEILVVERATFTGNWNGLEGTLKFKNMGTMVGPGLFHIESIVVRGTGDLAGVYGWGSVDVDITTLPAPSATYSFDLYWEEND